MQGPAEQTSGARSSGRSNQQIIFRLKKNNYASSRSSKTLSDTENHQLIKLYKLKSKTITTALHDCRVGIRYAGYLLQVSLKLINRSNIL